ncbi:hypothetical protein MRI28_17230 [Nocardiopsis dassonvillei]|uniref:hypothetical protein n=1 Tax=Nocardiopsis dassonvillei TaxID=2014 RepID=UPI00200E9EAF|nr:hypothetical protein [Nocardiopsis dassonvillei]MCK9871359.1 hypothetical protein [Nocardiopsis dassonvillei]
MRNAIGTGRLSTIAVLLGVLVLMSLACSLVRSDDTTISVVPVASQFTADSGSAVTADGSGSGEAQASHPCGVPQSQPSVASSPLLGVLTVLPLLELFEPPAANTSPRPVAETLPSRHGEGLLTFLCVQRV